MVKKIWITWFFLLFPVLAFAAIPDWKIIPAESSLTFTATQNNAPATGKFTQFSGDIHFDPAQLKGSNVRIVVNMASVKTDYAEIAKTLQTADWFNVATFPEAVFTASDFTKTGDKTYQANGNLTIRDKTVPTVLAFTLEEFSPTKAKVKGTVTLKRLAFGVGQGEWQKTDNIKDEVQVQFEVSAINMR